jgi:hypothetical protein
LKNLFGAAVSLGGDERNDALMVSLRHQAVEGRRRLDVNRNTVRLGLLDKVGKLPIGPLDEKPLKWTAAGSQGLANGMQPIQ